MERLLVRFEVPAAGIDFDVFLPLSLATEDAESLLIEAAENLSRGSFQASGQEILCVERLGGSLPSGIMISQCGLENGDRLVLV